MMELEALGKRYEVLKPWMDIGVHWATKYYIRMDKMNAYVVAMCKSFNWPISLITHQLHLQSSIPPYGSHGSKANGMPSISGKQKRSFWTL